MAAGSVSEQLTDEQIRRLAEVVSDSHMEAIAYEYLELEYETVANFRRIAERDPKAFNSQIIKRWRNRTPDSSGQKLADVLQKVAAKYGSINYKDIEKILKKSEEETDLSQHSSPHLVPQMDRAYIDACREGTKKVFNPRMILAGYAEAGKTSLAHRLLGEKFNKDEGRTDCIALHHIESTFNNLEEEKKGGQWKKKTPYIMDILSNFSRVVLQRMPKYGDESDQNDVSEESRIQNDSHTRDKGQKQMTLVEEFPLKVFHPETKHSQTANISPQERDLILRSGNLAQEQESEENTRFSISLWDLGGQDEFIATHHLFLNTEATIVIVMDITKGMHQLVGGKYVFGDINSVVESLDYWLNLFHTDASTYNRTPNIAIVLTHIDKIPKDLNRNEEIGKFKESILERIKDKPYNKYIDINNIYAVDNTAEDDSVFQDLRNQLLKHLSNQNTWGMDMPLTWFKLKADIKLKAEESKQRHLCLHEVWELGEHVRMDTDAVESFLKRQTVLGDLVYFPDFRDPVITHPQWLVDKCKALITTHEFIDRREGLPEMKEALKKGQITESGLKQLWNNDGVVFLIKLMEKFDLLVDVSDESCRKYVIPCMLPPSKTKITQQGVPLKLLTDTFPQLVSKCSKLKNWKLSWDNLSYTTATFHIGNDVRLDLWLSSFRDAQTRIWCSDDSDHRNTRSEIRAILEVLLEPSEKKTPTYGYKKLTDVMLWNLSKKFTTQSDARTLAYALGMTGSEVDRCFTSHQYDISNADSVETFRVL